MVVLWWHDQLIDSGPLLAANNKVYWCSISGPLLADNDKLFYWSTSGSPSLANNPDSMQTLAQHWHWQLALAPTVGPMAFWLADATLVWHWLNLLQVYIIVSSVSRTVKFKLETYRSSLYHKQSGVWGISHWKNKDLCHSFSLNCNEGHIYADGMQNSMEKSPTYLHTVVNMAGVFPLERMLPLLSCWVSNCGSLVL